jgi:3-methyladenine DNA glycosylase AlkD
MTDVIRNIRTCLLRAMNGVISSCMREKGVFYKQNYGVFFPQLKRIAANFTPSKELAESLWQDDVREHKVLATLLYPVDEFTREEAELWVKDVHNQEVAEYYCMNLLQHLSFAEELASEWICRDTEEYVVVIGYLIYVRLLVDKGLVLDDRQADILIDQAKKEMDKGESLRQRAAILALKRCGRKNNARLRERILQAVSEYALSGSPEKREFYNDLKFEFGYYHNV